jgi:hypothetical protein
MDFQAQVNEILKNRRNNVPKIEVRIEKVRQLKEKGENLLEIFGKIRADPNSPADLGLDAAMGVISDRLPDLDAQKIQLEHLRKRFKRGSVNIGVSGQARVGKSTLLQSISGLSDDQIPTGIGLPVTAVHSRIFNQDGVEKAIARIKFHTVDSFFNKYIRSHLEQLKGQTWNINGLDAFAAFSFPQNINEKEVSNPTEAANSLKKLLEAQKALPHYRSSLRGDTKIINDLKELRPYVAYPTNEQIESNDAEALKRIYLAVEDIEVFHPFPSLPGSGFGLVDLPGLGEVGDSVAKMHLDGLENEVDHVIMVLRPTDTGSFVGKQVVNNIDNLYGIQKAINNRGNFICILINKDKEAEQKGLVKILQDDINRGINDGKPDSKFNVYTINAKEKADVDTVLEQILNRLTDNLPVMDGEVLDAALRQQESIENDLGELLSGINKKIRDLCRQYPSDTSQVFDDAKKMRGKLAVALVEDIKDKQRENIDPEKNTEDKKRYFASVEEIYRKNEAAIENSLWKGDVWDEDAAESIAGDKGPAGFFEDECNRIRVEIASSFEEMNTYYDERLDKFLAAVAELYKKHTGNFVLSGLSGKDTVGSIVKKLETAGYKMNHLENAFKWLAGLRFDFRQNVFPEIREALTAIESDVPDRNPRNLLDANTLPLDLREKVQVLKKQLQSHAMEANYNIYTKLNECDQLIERFIFAALEYFDDIALRAEDWHKEYIEFCRQFRDDIWPEKYNEPNTESALFKAVATGIEETIKLIEAK